MARLEQFFKTVDICAFVAGLHGLVNVLKDSFAQLDLFVISVNAPAGVCAGVEKGDLDYQLIILVCRKEGCDIIMAAGRFIAQLR